MNYSYLTLLRFQTVFWLKISFESMVYFFQKITFQRQPEALLPATLEGKVAFITGANRGLGLEMARTFARLGARVLLGCRSREAGEQAIASIRAEINENYRGNLTLIPLDLASFDSIYKCAARVKQTTARLDYLINNASIMMTSEQRSVDGLELQFATNYLGHFLLTNLLLELLEAAPQARVINLTSISHCAYIINFDNINLTGGAYSPIRGYGQSKLAMVLFTRELARRLSSKTNITTYTVHPGLIKTELYSRSDSCFSRATSKYFGNMGMITPWQAIQTILKCALEPALGNESGHFYHHCKRIDNLIDRINDADAQRLWLLSAQLCGFEV